MALDLAPAELLAVIRGRNPWLSIAAMRVVLRRSDIALDDVLLALTSQHDEPALIDRASSVRQAVLLGMIVAHDLTATQRAAVIAHLGRMIGQAHSPADLRGLLLVAWALRDLSFAREAAGNQARTTEDCGTANSRASAGTTTACFPDTRRITREVCAA